jgi:hypothetical protein
MNKVKITKLKTRPTHNNSLVKGRYIQNTNKLSLLPKIFLILVVLFIVGFCIFYYYPRGNSSDVEGINESIPKVIPIDIPIDSNQEVGTSQNILDNSKKITLQINNEDCEYLFQINESTIEPKITKDDQIFWVPTNCNLKNIIQVIRLRSDEIDSLNKNINNDRIFQNLDGIDTFAIIYGENSQNFPLISQYLKLLAQFENSQNYYFNTSLAYSQKKIGNNIYYLDGNCQNGGSDPCKLWRIGVYEDRATLLQKNIAQTGVGEANELKPNFSLNFAKTQDFKDGINFIYIDQITKNIKLIRVRTSNNNYDIINSQILEPDHPNYSVYYI